MGPARAHLCMVLLGNCGGSLSGSCSRSLSLILSSWAGAHQISWLPFIALFLIEIILGEEIAVSHPHLTRSLRNRLIYTHTHPMGVGRGCQEAGHLWEGREQAFLAGEGKEGACMWRRKEISRTSSSAQVKSWEGQSAALSTQREFLPPSAPATSRTGSDPSIRAQLCPKQRERLLRAADQREVSTPPCSGLGPGLHCPGTPSQKGNPSWKTMKQSCG